MYTYVRPRDISNDFHTFQDEIQDIDKKIDSNERRRCMTEKAKQRMKFRRFNIKWRC